MKCPFRLVRKVRYVRYATNDNINDYNEETEFAECLQNECPYYGKNVMKHRPMGGWEFVTEPVCRRCEGEK